jgi:TatD DNase family protein
MEYIDTHAHIDTIFEREGNPPDSSLDALWERMAAYGPLPSKIVHVSCDPKDFDWALGFLDKVPSAYGAFGVHPIEAAKWDSDTPRRLRECLQHPKAVAVGETGLDFHYPENLPAEAQLAVWRAQIELAIELRMPLVLHLREAEELALRVLREYDSPSMRAHIHCFTGTPEFVDQVMQLAGRYFIGVTGAVTFKKTETVREAVRRVPKDRLLLETDAPYLAPPPWRGKPSYPTMIPKIVETIAQVRGESEEEVFALALENTKAMYGI